MFLYPLTVNAHQLLIAFHIALINISDYAFGWTSTQTGLRSSELWSAADYLLEGYASAEKNPNFLLSFSILIFKLSLF